jgi:signal transduction histidine kinase
VIQTTYDIIKTHGGEIKVETKEARLNDGVGQGEGAAFIIQLPLV